MFFLSLFKTFQIIWNLHYSVIKSLFFFFKSSFHIGHFSKLVRLVIYIYKIPLGLPGRVAKESVTQCCNSSHPKLSETRAVQSSQPSSPVTAVAIVEGCAHLFEMGNPTLLAWSLLDFQCFCQKLAVSVLQCIWDSTKTRCYVHSVYLHCQTHTGFSLLQFRSFFASGDHSSHLVLTREKKNTV